MAITSSTAAGTTATHRAMWALDALHLIYNYLLKQVDSTPQLRRDTICCKGPKVTGSIHVSRLARFKCPKTSVLHIHFAYTKHPPRPLIHVSLSQ